MKIPISALRIPALLASLMCAMTAEAKTPVSYKKTAASAPPHTTAIKVDQLIIQKLHDQGKSVTDTIDDIDFLRRVTLDIAGRIPSADEVRRFANDPSSDKRQEKVSELLQSADFSRNWAAYFRDVVFMRATDSRAVGLQGFFENWLAGQLTENPRWDVIAEQMITATGDARENGATGLILAHDGNPEELAGEVSRIFLGIQIQCANCHNHPSDAWTREQFHELAAFFPRVRVQPKLNQTPRTFEIVSFDVARRDPREIFENPERLMQFLDRNRNSKIEKEEATRLPRFNTVFERILPYGDANGDGAISVTELKEMPAPAVPFRGNIEYYMPDLSDPNAEGTLIQPAFFISNQKPTTGLKDLDRRRELASYITSENNEWFAKSFVNRIWTELVGDGFYRPVDDIGPLRVAAHEQALNELADGFIASGYHIPWLFETIIQTKTYQRKLQTNTGGADESVAFACSTPTRMRSDQIYESLTNLTTPALANYRMSGNGQNMLALFARNSPKGRFSEVFGFDPSTPQDDLQETIPQALFMMNSETIDNLVSARGNGPLARLLRQYDNDELVLRELYLMTLSREPTEKELEICQEHYLQVGQRTETLEDIFWCLVNSSEFMTKR